MNQETIYIDCNRAYAQIKSDTNKNEWTNQLAEGVKIPAGSQIKIQNAFINYQGLQGGSIEIEENINTSLNIGYYISHSDFLIPRWNSQLDPILDQNDPFYTETIEGMRAVFLNCFYDVNNPLLVSNAFRTKYTTTNITTTQGRKDDGSYTGISVPLSTYFSNFMNFGGTEQPLCAVKVGATGYIEPVINNVPIYIQKGIYGINQLAQLIQDQCNGVRVYTNLETGSFKTEIEKQLENSLYKGDLASGFCKVGQFWDYKMTSGGADRTTFYDITINATPAEMANFCSSDRFLFVQANVYNIIMQAHSDGTPYLTELLWSNFKNSYYYAGLWQPWDPKASRPLHAAAPAVDQIIIGDYHNEKIGDNFNDYQLFWNFRPTENGYYLGTSDFNIEYDTVNDGYAITFLHSPRRIDSHDMLGNQNSEQGKIVSFLKRFTWGDILSGYGYSNDEINTVTSTMSNPRQRNGGIFIYNWDFATCEKFKTKLNIVVGQVKNKYKSFQDFFNGYSDAKIAWENTLWFRLGFSYDQLQHIDNFESIKSFDQPIFRLYGKTTNNELDITAQNTIASYYSGMISGYPDSQENTVNKDYPQRINEQVKNYDLQNSNRVILQPSQFCQNSLKYVYYINTQTIPILTNSRTIKADNLPQLSKQGYFLITSDITDRYNDLAKKNSPMSLLGIVPKSSLSNQDFISAFNDIVHVTSQDMIINKVKIKILNADLTNPDLGNNSSIMLQIIRNIPIPIAPEDNQDKETDKNKK